MHALVYVLYVLYVASSLVQKLGGAWERGYVASTCCTSAVQAIEMSGDTAIITRSTRSTYTTWNVIDFHACNVSLHLSHWIICYHMLHVRGVCSNMVYKGI